MGPYQVNYYTCHITQHLLTLGGRLNLLPWSVIMTNIAHSLSLISVFYFQTNQIRTVMRDGDPWFIDSDVAAALGYHDAVNAAKNLSAHQKAETQIVSSNLGSAKQGCAVTIINESGLFRLALHSRKPRAIAFSDWVTDEVLPSIRKASRYAYSNDTVEHSATHLLRMLTAPYGANLPQETLKSLADACLHKIDGPARFSFGDWINLYALNSHMQAIHQIYRKYQMYDSLKALGSRAGIELHDHIGDGCFVASSFMCKYEAQMDFAKKENERLHRQHAS